MKINIAFLIVVLFMPACSCRKKEKPLTNAEIQQTEEALVGANRILVKKDREKIRAYIDSNNLIMQETPSGLWFAVNHHGSGAKARANYRVSLKYSVELLDGTVCYNSDSLGIKQFRLGKGGVESGLEEGVLMLSEGDQATFIMPPHLAQGLPGDGNRIPARSIIVYKVVLLKVEP